MIRTRSNALIASGAGLLVAAIIGIQLGESAVSEIDPVHFQGPAEPLIGIDPVAARPAAPDPFAQEYVWSQNGAPSALCAGDCEARQARAVAAAAVAEPARDVAAPYWRDVTPTTELRPWQPGAVPYSGLSVERYMHYPVTQGEAADAAAAARTQEAVALEPAAPALAPAPGEEPADE